MTLGFLSFYYILFTLNKEDKIYFKNNSSFFYFSLNPLDFIFIPLDLIKKIKSLKEITFIIKEIT